MGYAHLNFDWKQGFFDVNVTIWRINDKKERQIKGLREGLKELEIYDIVKSNTEIFQSVKFRMSNLSVSLKLKKPREKVMTIFFIWLEQFISESSDKVAQMFLKFSSSFSVVQLTENIEINTRKKIVGSDSDRRCF